MMLVACERRGAPAPSHSRDAGICARDKPPLGDLASIEAFSLTRSGGVVVAGALPDSGGGPPAHVVERRDDSGHIVVRTPVGPASFDVLSPGLIGDMIWAGEVAGERSSVVLVDVKQDGSVRWTRRLWGAELGAPGAHYLDTTDDGSAVITGRVTGTSYDFSGGPVTRDGREDTDPFVVWLSAMGEVRGIIFFRSAGARPLGVKRQGGRTVAWGMFTHSFAAGFFSLEGSDQPRPYVVVLERNRIASAKALNGEPPIDVTLSDDGEAIVTTADACR